MKKRSLLASLAETDEMLVNGVDDVSNTCTWIGLDALMEQGTALSGRDT
jgi:hypothetical protein